MKKKIRWDILLLSASLICFIIYGVISLSNYKLKKEAEDTKVRINEIHKNAEEAVGQSKSPYEALFKANSDMKAWLLIPDTNIDYPVMQTLEEEEYYLTRNFFGEEDKNGTLFIDTDCSLEDNSNNVIIHGHHMKSGEMFGELDKYMDKDYGKEHSRIYLYTQDNRRVYEVMSVFNSKVYKSRTKNFLYYNYFKFETQEQFDTYYENIKKMSMYDTGVSAEFGDEFMTLSTCAYHTKNGRFAVVAKRIE